ncbi:hypothetical protein ACFQAT_20165 [Undibacterium arcticum]|uniref:Uncharacterized protein n=1 Tax=Undibacterium arcticum TaxID=1762892 RepID=A0ABV7EYB9_9BURK
MNRLFRCATLRVDGKLRTARFWCLSLLREYIYAIARSEGAEGAEGAEEIIDQYGFAQ